MHALAHVVRKPADREHILRSVHGEAIFETETSTRFHFACEGLEKWIIGAKASELGVICGSSLHGLMIPKFRFLPSVLVQRRRLATFQVGSRTDAPFNSQRALSIPLPPDRLHLESSVYSGNKTLDTHVREEYDLTMDAPENLQLAI